jgi:hypothetical protein
MGELPPEKIGGHGSAAAGLTQAIAGRRERDALGCRLDLACCASRYGTPYRIH